MSENKMKLYVLQTLSLANDFNIVIKEINLSQHSLQTKGASLVLMVTKTKNKTICLIVHGQLFCRSHFNSEHHVIPIKVATSKTYLIL